VVVHDHRLEPVGGQALAGQGIQQVPQTCGVPTGAHHDRHQGRVQLAHRRSFLHTACSAGPWHRRPPRSGKANPVAALLLRLLRTAPRPPGRWLLCGSSGGRCVRRTAMPVQPLLQHPLAALRSQLGLTAAKYLDRLDDSHHALGYGRMAKRREKVSRWESGINAPDEPARYAMAHLHGIPPAAVTELGWPNFLLLAFPGDRPVLDSPWSPAGTVEAVAAIARGGSMDRRGFLISSGAALSGIAANWSNAVTALPLPLDAPGRRLDPDVMTRLEQRMDDLRHLDDVLSG